MYEVRNNRNDVLTNHESFIDAKLKAEEFKQLDDTFMKSAPNRKSNGPFSVYEVRQVWTTQTLDEAIGE